MAHRVDRVNEEIKRELSRLIREEVKDYRLQGRMVSIVKVDSSNDFKIAKVYISVLEGKEARDEVTEALNGAKGYLRRELGKRLKTYHTPQINFVSDDTLEYGIKMNVLISELNKKNHDK